MEHQDSTLRSRQADQALPGMRPNRSNEAFLHQFDLCKGDLWGFLFNHLSNHHDAEDLYQDIFMKAYQNQGKLRDPAKFRSWLFAIAANSMRSFFRKKRPLSIEEEGIPDPIERSPQPGARVEQRQQLGMLRQCLLQLPERDRQVLLLEAMAELGQAEIANQMGMNLNTLKTVLRRSKIKLARLMAEVTHG